MACDTVSLGVMGIGFDTSGFDIAVVVRYNGDNMFDSVIDSTRWPITQLDGDTTSIIHPTEQQIPNSHEPIPPVVSGGYLMPGYNYIVRFTVEGITDTFTNITLDGKTSQVFTRQVSVVAPGPVGCEDMVISCKINGVLTPAIVTAGTTADTLGMIYLHK